MFNRLVIIHSCWLLISLMSSLALQAQNTTETPKAVLCGRVIDSNTGDGVSFATLVLEKSSKGVVCDINGHFSFPELSVGNYSIRVASINYTNTVIDIELKRDSILLIPMQEQSLTLPEVEVMASFRTAKGSNAIIGQAALEYIQPISLGDIFLLLPGSVISNHSMHQFNHISSRQVGTDKNTSLGMGFIADGIPITNDAMRTQLYGITGEDDKNTRYTFDRLINKRRSMNAGIDMRNISTDHIESVEIVRGISSVKDGNLSSGAIHIKSKKGVTPLRIRAKGDPLNKLLYMGKGIKLSDKLGAIHIGADVLSSTPDVREMLDRFTRLSAQANYTNQLYLNHKVLDISLKLNLTSSVNNVKSDELIAENEETYKSTYFQSSLAFTANWQLNSPWIEEIELLTSANFTQDILTRHKLVLSTTGPSSMPISTMPGEHEGVFLPVKYYSDYTMDNKPLYFFLQNNFKSEWNMGKVMQHRLLYGWEFKSNKNIGEGAILNPYRPPYPSDNTFIRPRANYLIPTFLHTAAYVEDNIDIPMSKQARLECRLGVRATKLINLPSTYALGKTVLVEPRTQVRYIIESKIDQGIEVSHAFRIGYGEENKLPTLDMLYPDKLYRDFAVLNAFFQDPERDYLLVNTYIHNPVNADIKENKNTKIETGWDFRRGDFECAISAFREVYKGGFSYFRNYYPIAFTRYIEPINPPIVGKPGKEDYYPEYYQDFTVFPTVQNAAKTIKRGIEYRIKTPMIKALRTSVEINGSYYSTIYTKGVPMMYRPTVTEFGNKYPYVGIYEGDTHLYRNRFNTNFWVNTHIERFGLIFTNFLQIIWFSDMRKGKEESVQPSCYMDLDGNIHDVDAHTMETTTGVLRHLRRTRSELYYRTERKPVSIFMNLKASKELGNKTKLSFFVNNIIDFNPHYKKANQTTEREWVIPFFGAELIIHI